MGHVVNPNLYRLKYVVPFKLIAVSKKKYAEFNDLKIHLVNNYITSFFFNFNKNIYKKPFAYIINVKLSFNYFNFITYLNLKQSIHFRRRLRRTFKRTKRFVSRIERKSKVKKAFFFKKIKKTRYSYILFFKSKFYFIFFKKKKKKLFKILFKKNLYFKRKKFFKKKSSFVVNKLKIKKLYGKRAFRKTRDDVKNWKFQKYVKKRKRKIYYRFKKLNVRSKLFSKKSLKKKIKRLKLSTKNKKIGVYNSKINKDRYDYSYIFNKHKRPKKKGQRLVEAFKKWCRGRINNRKNTPKDFNFSDFVDVRPIERKKYAQLARQWPPFYKYRILKNQRLNYKLFNDTFKHIIIYDLKNRNRDSKQSLWFDYARRHFYPPYERFKKTVIDAFYAVKQNKNFNFNTRFSIKKKKIYYNTQFNSYLKFIRGLSQIRKKKKMQFIARDRAFYLSGGWHRAKKAWEKNWREWRERGNAAFDAPFLTADSLGRTLLPIKTERYKKKSFKEKFLEKLNLRRKERFGTFVQMEKMLNISWKKLHRGRLLKKSKPKLRKLESLAIFTNFFFVGSRRRLLLQIKEGLETVIKKERYRAPYIIRQKFKSKLSLKRNKLKKKADWRYWWKKNRKWSRDVQYPKPYILLWPFYRYIHRLRSKNEWFFFRKINFVVKKKKRPYKNILKRYYILMKKIEKFKNKSLNKKSIKKNVNFISNTKNKLLIFRKSPLLNYRLKLFSKSKNLYIRYHFRKKMKRFLYKTRKRLRLIARKRKLKTKGFIIGDNELSKLRNRRHLKNKKTKKRKFKAKKFKHNRLFFNKQRFNNSQKYSFKNFYQLNSTKTLNNSAFKQLKNKKFFLKYLQFKLNFFNTSSSKMFKKIFDKKSRKRYKFNNNNLFNFDSIDRFKKRSFVKKKKFKKKKKPNKKNLFQKLFSKRSKKKCKKKNLSLILKYRVRLKLLKLKKTFVKTFLKVFVFGPFIKFFFIIRKVWGTKKTAEMFSEAIIIRLLKKNKIKEIIGSVITYFKNFMLNKLLGAYSIIFAGRFTRKDRAMYSWHKTGKYSRSNRLVLIDYSNRRVALKYSSCSFKINLIRSIFI